MKLKVKNPGFEYMINLLFEFYTNQQTSFWLEPLFHFYPQLNREHLNNLDDMNKKQYIRDVMKNVYDENINVIETKVTEYQNCWTKYSSQIVAALSDAFDLDCNLILNNMEDNISIIPIEPRYLDTKSFDTFYLNSENGFIGSAIHEIIHFVWFYVWNNLFHDTYDEYETPSLKWIFSEMVVETIMKDERLSSINPYFKRENGGCIYPYFFDMTTNGDNTLEVIDKMYNTQSITDFMKNGFIYLKKYENEIREHIKQAENNF